MIDLTNSHSLTDFQRNARDYIAGLNESRKPLLLTANGKIQAVLLDPVTFRDMEVQIERHWLIAAIEEGEKAVQSGLARSADRVQSALEAK